MRFVDKEKKQLSIEELDRKPGERFIKPVEILAFAVLVILILIILFPEKEFLPEKKETTQVVSTGKKTTKKEQKKKVVSKFSLTYIKQLLAKTDYRYKERVLKKYINELLTVGKIDLALTVLNRYKIYIKNPKDYLYLKYDILLKKYIR